MNFSKSEKIEIFENAISWIVVFAMFIYGSAKFFQFESSSGIDKTVAEMSGMELMWAFYGYSKSFAVPLGTFEIIGGLLILIPKTRIIGCLFTSAILLNVILQDFYFNIPGVLKVAVLYQVFIFIILWLNREKLMNALRILLQSKKTDQTRSGIFLKAGLAFLLFVVLRIAEYYFTMKL